MMLQLLHVQAAYSSAHPKPGAYRSHGIYLVANAESMKRGRVHEGRKQGPARMWHIVICEFDEPLQPREQSPCHLD
jgi:hypothetical protein